VAATEQERLETNLRLYSWYLPLSRIYFWAPIFFLYFSSRFSISEVLVLGSVYYLSVVVFELPSGYLSDRLGRTTTLRLSALALALSYVFFLLGGTSFVAFASAQMLLALGYAAISGTDTALHFDTLAGLGREDEFPAREARLSRNAYLAGGLGALLAGAVAQRDLSYAYVLALANALLLVVLTLRLHEPRRPDGGWPSRDLFEQVLACVRCLREPLLLWFFLYMVLMVIVAHIPSEFAQPYVAAVLGDDMRDVQRTPIVTGVLVSVNTFVAAMAAAYSLSIRKLFGAAGTLLGLTFGQVGVIVAMAATVSPLVAGLLVLRSAQPAISAVLINAEVTPRLSQSIRASYLSLNSLAGRLGYGGLLLLLSAVAGVGAPNDPQTLARVLTVAAWVSVPLFLLLCASWRVVREVPPETTSAERTEGPG